MSPIDVEVALKRAFAQCEVAGVPLAEQQKELLLKTAIASLQTSFSANANAASSDAVPSEVGNPLALLPPDQRQVLLDFIAEQTRDCRSWKAQLLNDWLAGRDSGTVQCLRDRYGLQWLEQITDEHIAAYQDAENWLQVGDRIEVSNGLWEWVQEDGPCRREWFPCTVTAMTNASDASETLPTSYQEHTNCTVRFDNGMEYEIQGIYEWNRYNWRRP
jgi:hypothetical protein